MRRRKLFWAMSLALAVIALCWGGNPAQAGPGTYAGADANATPSGGTFYANSPLGTWQYCNAAGACSAISDSGTPLRKFVDKVPGVGPTNANNLGQYIPIATKITNGLFPGDDYYEIGIVEYNEQMHSDLPGPYSTPAAGPGTKLRGYKDLAPSAVLNPAHYLGPLIIADRNIPVRIKFTSMLATGAPGNLFIPVDPTLMGAGPGPLDISSNACDPDVAINCESYTENRTAVHLHGGFTPWISDGTPHQWFTPFGESTVFPKGVSFQNVPDMWYNGSGNPVASGTLGAVADPGSGSQTIIYSNQQSARLMFYHEHALGITRLGVYAGLAAGYLLKDSTEEGLITAGTIPGATMPAEYRYGIPLIIQDRTFVPNDVSIQDAKWFNSMYPSRGTYGDLWFPHVYETNQQPYPASADGTNAFGRWDYGPWFWPVFPVNKSPLPEPSAVPEAFMDTPIVNGTAYPYLEVERKAYRFRILNASNDRFLNLQLYTGADKGTTNPIDPTQSSAKTSLFWRNTATGENVAWTMDGPVLASVASLPPVYDLNWQIVATADFNRDGKNDILWRNRTTGVNRVWFMDGATKIGSADLNTVADPNWAIVGTGDFDGDGNPDILWRNASTGTNRVWYMVGVTKTGNADLPAVADPNWAIVGTGDFDGDGRPDILWRNASTGTNRVWYMVGVTKTGNADLSPVADPSWSIVGTGDLNNDGRPDILWRNASTGTNRVWYMVGVTKTGNADLPAVADPNWGAKTGGSSGVLLCNGTQTVPQTSCTEVKMVPAVATTGFPAIWPTDGRAGGVPDPATVGPKMIQIGTEGGFLPSPVEIPNQPIDYEYFRRSVTVLNVSTKALFLGPAERADVIIDFSQVPAGSTLIMYNDAPAPVPAFDTRIDYYTGDPDQLTSGGAPSTKPGFGPNTRTIMQFRVLNSAVAPAFDLAKLQTDLPIAFASSQDQPIVAQAAYTPAYGTLPDNFASIFTGTLNFPTFDFTDINGVLQSIPVKNKAIQELFEPEYGRMNATLGVELPATSALIQTTLPLGYIDPTTETLYPNDTVANPVQIWKITHNGVDTHAVHIHLVNWQLINRVGWDGTVKPPDANEIGWKETIRMNPLEDIIVAVRPALPLLPSLETPPAVFPTSTRSPNPARPDTWTFQSPDTTTGGFITVTNTPVSYGYEYVWHCHLLGHEENDMMRPLVVQTGDSPP
jgi:FtsP/CotA-like multicopper oxidase with cupredoxin domain